MKGLIIVLIVIGIMMLLGVGFEIGSRIASRHWRKWFDSLSPDQQRKEQELLYKEHL